MKTSDKIIDYVKARGQVTGNELIDYLSITDRAVRKQLKALIDNGQLKKSGRPPRVYYSIADEPESMHREVADSSAVTAKTKNIIEEDFLYITPRGTVQEGWNGFEYWCSERNFELVKMAARYDQISRKYGQHKKAGLIDGMHKMKTSFQDVALDAVFYIDFYSIEIFGKTKLGQLLLFAKQSQNRTLMNELAAIVKPTVTRLIEKYQIDGVGFIPPTVKREVQLMKQIQIRLDLGIRTVAIFKIKTPVAVPQKTLNKLEDRIINARETISVDEMGSYNNILLIDDAVGSGSTLNETAKKIRQKGICKGKIIGLAITGSFNGFEVISEV
jgi:DNA-binding transcriptional ArsR family regulator/hypoxanthine-guanine phosphoribosyltransferase